MPILPLRNARAKPSFAAPLLAALLGCHGSAAPGGKPEATPYTVEAVGEDGSVIFPRPAPKAYDRWTFSDPPASVDAMDLIDSRGGVAFALAKKLCAERHCTLCVMRPLRLRVQPFEKLDLAGMEQKFIDFAKANGALEVMKPGENVLPREDGYDTDYHLNDIGVKIMEPRIVAALKSVL